MSRYLKSMASLNSILDMYFSNWAEERVIGVGKNLCKKRDVVLVYSLYTIGRYQKDEDAEYDLFGSNDMDDMS